MPDAARGRAAPMFRREFKIGKAVRHAQLFICGLGYYEVYINGGRVGDHVLDPAQTDYDIRAFYVIHEIAGFLHSGMNAIGVILGDGWYNQDRVWKDSHEGKGMSYGSPRFIAKLEMLSSDIKISSVLSDESWKCARSPIIENSIYAGEKYDARLDQPGWNVQGFDDSSWTSPALVPEPCSRLERQEIPPIRKIREFVPKAIVEARPGTWVVDMGQNFSGWARISATAPEGTEIRMRFAETVSQDGMVDTGSTGVFATKVEQVDTYVCKGSGRETWEPRFTCHGFRYVEITGWPGTPSCEDVIGILVHTALEKAGVFECSDERMNLLHKMAFWTHRSNIHGIPEDCPARERCAWLGDANIVCEYSMWNFKSADFWEKYLGDIETSRSMNGGIPFNVSPGRRTCGNASHDRMAAFILIPWYLYVCQGRKYLLERHYAGMKAVLERFKEMSSGWILSGGFGDCFEPGMVDKPTLTPEVLTTTIWFFRCAQVMSKTAHILGHSADGMKYGEWTASIREAFLKRFYKPGSHGFGSQTADTMALHFGLVPDGETENVLAALVKDLRETRSCHCHVGIFGLRYLFETLARHGHADLAFDLLHQDSYPSFGDLMNRGATTLWEYWGEPEVDRAHGPRSLNHPMMGGFDNWFFNSLAGIRPDEDSPGFSHFFLEPHPVTRIRWLDAKYESPFGMILSSWKFDGDNFLWEVDVPEGTEATVILPYSGDVKLLPPGQYAFEKFISAKKK